MRQFQPSLGSSDSTSRAMALTIATASKPIPIRPVTPVTRHRRPSRYEVTEQLIMDIAEAVDSPSDHGYMGDDSIIMDKVAPELSESSQGAYMLKRRGTNIPVGVFKPSDEEVKAAADESYLSPKMGVVVGDGAIKEHAAYVLDHGAHAGVPRTETVVLMEHNLDMDELEELPQPPLASSPRRVGSFQEFREHMCTSEDLGSSLFAVDDVHRIGLLDLRLFNLDRHLGNILVQLEEGRYKLIPIDHGYILPSFRCLSDAWFCWTNWKQASAPFSDACKAHIESLTPFADIARLKRIGLRDECILTYVLCTVFVKEAVHHDWNLKAMALAMQRDISADDSLSDFELLVKAASTRAAFDSFEFTDAESWGSAGMLAFLDEYEEVVQSYMLEPSAFIASQSPQQQLQQ